MTMPVTDPTRVFDYKRTYKSYPNIREVEVLSVSEGPKTVVATVRERAPKGEWYTYKRRLTKYLLIGGPAAGEMRATPEVPDDYQQFNASYRGRRKDGQSAIFVHESLLDGT